MNEADTCRKFVVPLLQAAGWDNDPHSINEQRYFSEGRIVVRGNYAERRKDKRVDYLLRCRSVCTDNRISQLSLALFESYVAEVRCLLHEIPTGDTPDEKRKQCTEIWETFRIAVNKLWLSEKQLAEPRKDRGK